jgi:hypothetical protein
MTSDYEVFLCEDIEHMSTIQAQLDAHRGDRPRLRIVDQATTLDDAMDRLFDRSSFPDLVLIDDLLGRGGDASPRPSAIELMSHIWKKRRAVGRETDTRCVLWTADYDPLLYWAFRVCGGRHVIVKSRTLVPDRAEILYSVLERRAEWWPRRPTLALQPNQREVIRYFYEATDRSEIAERLGIDVAVVIRREQELRRTLIEQLPTEELAKGAVALAKRVFDDGWVWVRPQEDHKLPTGAPLPRVLDPAMIPRD